jgi:hypothetical protein
MVKVATELVTYIVNRFEPERGNVNIFVLYE